MTAASSIDQMMWQDLGVELVFTQNEEGNYSSFWWQAAAEWEIEAEKIIGTSVLDTMAEDSQVAYRSKVNKFCNGELCKITIAILIISKNLFPLN